MKYFDAHMHVVDTKLIYDAQRKDVSTFICNATSQKDWNAVLALSDQIPGVYACLGIHPWYVNTVSDDWRSRLEAYLRHRPNLMIGEIGLDLLRPDFDRQKEVFRSSLELAAQYNRTVHIHCVKAWDSLFEILSEFKNINCLFHRFSGDAVVAQKLRFTNSFFSVMNKNVLDILPDNRILVESDSPDGIRSPAFIPELIEKLRLDPSYLAENFEEFITRIGS